MMAMNIEPTILKELNIMALNYFEDTISIYYRGFCSYLAIKKKGLKTIFKKKYSFLLWCSWLLLIKNNKSKFAKHIWPQAVQQLEVLRDEACYLATVS